MLYDQEMLWFLHASNASPHKARTTLDDEYESYYCSTERVYLGLYRILSAVGEFSYFITSHLKTSRLLEVNLNDIKKTSCARYTWLDIQIDRS